jgi:hypothetical protein
MLALVVFIFGPKKTEVRKIEGGATDLPSLIQSGEMATSLHPNSEDDYSRNPYVDIEQGEQGAGLVQNDSLQEDGRGTSSHHHSPSLSSKAKGKVRRLKEMSSGVGEAVLEGYHSGTAWLYAFRGIWFFIFNPSLWFVVVCPLACSSFFSILSVVLLLVFALPAQAHLLYNVIEVTWFPMWLAWLIAVALTLIEAAMVVMLLTQFLFNCYKTMLEERVFRLRGLNMTDDSSTVAIACANVISQSLFAWLVMLITIPLNLVPVIGNLLFFMLSGTVFAWNLHAGYFGAKNLAFGQQGTSLLFSFLLSFLEYPFLSSLFPLPSSFFLFSSSPLSLISKREGG